MLGFNGGTIGIANTVFTGTKSNDPNYSSVSLLLNGNETSGSDPNYSSVSLLLNGNTTFTDSSSYGHTVTANGNAQISTTQSKFGGASMYFDGNGDYLSIPDSDQFEIGSGDFTFEAWIYLTGYSVAYQGQHYVAEIICKDSSSTGRGFNFEVRGTSTSWTTLRVNLFSSNSTLIGTSATTSFNLNTWYHVAAVRNGTSLRLYKNGVDVGGGTNAISVQNTTTVVTVGSQSPYYISQGYAYYFPGYIDDLRVTKGVARYISNFDPPTAQLPGNTITDSSSYGHTVTPAGNAQISTAQSKFGSASMYFDGSGDYLEVPSSAGFDFDYGSFTVEAWIYLTANGTTAANETHWPIVNKHSIYNTQTSTGGSNTAWEFRYSPQSGNKLVFVSRIEAGNFTDGVNIFSKLSTAVNLSLNTWYHVAAVRDGTTLKLFLNGQDVTDTNTGNYDWSTIDMSLDTGSIGQNKVRVGRILGGSNPGTVVWYAVGYIDDLRITKGVARYTSNFQPPTAQLPGGETGTFASGLWTSSDHIKQIRNELWPVFVPSIVTDGLVLHLDAGDSDSYPGTGTTWTDLSGHGNNVTLSGGPTYSSTNEGYLNFDGSNDYGYSPSFTADGRNYTLEVWFKTSTASGGCFIAANNAATGASISNYDRMMYIGTDGKLRFGHYDGSAEITTDTVTTNDNNWHHAVGTWDGTSLKFYRDNNLVSTNSAANASIDAGTKYWIIAGRRNSGWPSGDSSAVHYTPVDISIARIYWGKSLTSSEVTQNYNALRDRYGL